MTGCNSKNTIQSASDTGKMSKGQQVYFNIGAGYIVLIHGESTRRNRISGSRSFSWDVYGVHKVILPWLHGALYRQIISSRFFTYVKFLRQNPCITKFYDNVDIGAFKNSLTKVTAPRNLQIFSWNRRVRRNGQFVDLQGIGG